MTLLERRHHMAGWECSGQTKKAYCQSNGIKYATFIYWFRSAKEEESSAGQFIKLESQPIPQGLEVEFLNGVRLYLSEPLSIDLLRALANV